MERFGQTVFGFVSSMLVIGLTGNFGTGKTTVASLFAELGAKVIDTDKMAHRLMREDRACTKKIIKEFGKSILTLGHIDRKKLGDIVFVDSRRLKKLERIIHPKIIKEIKDKIAIYGKKRKGKVLVIDVPLLFESGLDKHVDVIIAVKADLEKQIQRTMKCLSLTRQEISNRIHAQMPMKEKLLLSDIIIDNRGTIQRTKSQVKKIWQELAS